MDILGSIGQLYTFVLLALLIIGFGLATWAIINYILKKKETMEETINSKLELVKKQIESGGNKMKNNNFIKLAVFSFMGIIVSIAILSVLPSLTGSNNAMYSNRMYSNGNMTNMSNTMQGMSNSNMSNSMTSQYTDTSTIQQQLNSMQQQINQIQYQLNNIGMNNSSMSGTMNNNSMNNNNMSNMNNNMNNGSSNSNNMNNSNTNSNSSSGSMSMPMM